MIVSDKKLPQEILDKVEQWKRLHTESQKLYQELEEYFYDKMDECIFEHSFDVVDKNQIKITPNSKVHYNGMYTQTIAFGVTNTDKYISVDCFF